MKMTLEQLREQNRAYAEQITPTLLEYVNKLIERIEQTRTNRPQPLDNVDLTTEYGQRFEQATIESAGVSSLTPQIVEHCTIEPVIYDDGTVGGTVGCGGAFHKFNTDKMTYKGTEQKTFKIYGGEYLSGYYPIYFDCTVSSFGYDARNRQQYAEQAREKAIQQSMSYGYDRKRSEEAFDAVTEMVYTKYKPIDEYSPIIRHANETLYDCGMLDRILTAEDLKALGKA